MATAIRSRNGPLLLRSVCSPKSSPTWTRSLSHRVLQGETTITPKTLRANFFTTCRPLQRTPSLIQFLQKRTYYPQYKKDYKRQALHYQIRAFLSNVVLGILIASSVTVYALQVHAISIPEFLRSRYRKLRDIDTFIQENFVLSEANLYMGRWWTYLTYTFCHGSLLHLGCNMYALYSFGTSFAAFFGPTGLALCYVVGGISGGMAFIAFRRGQGKDPNRGTVGASGSASAIMTGLAISNPYARYGVPFVPGSVPAWVLTAGFAGYSVVAEAVGLQNGIDHVGHLGGMGSGLALAILFRMIRRR